MGQLFESETEEGESEGVLLLRVFLAGSIV